MRSPQLSALLAVCGSVWILADCIATESAAAAAPAPTRITVLYDAFGRDESMTQDWGYAALVDGPDCFFTVDIRLSSCILHGSEFWSTTCDFYQSRHTGTQCSANP